MRNGFTFKNQHSSEFNVTVKTKSRPIRPSRKSYMTDVPCRDGVYDFSSSNEYGREFYNDRIFSVSIGVCADNLEQMQYILSKLSLWLCGNGDLIFDDIPLIVWKGRIIDEIIYMPENDGRKAMLEVSFRVEPFGYCIFDNNGPILDDALWIGSNIPIEMDTYYSFSLSGNGTVNFINCGDRPISPVISVANANGKIKFTLGNKSLTFTAKGNTEVDFEKHIVKCDEKSVYISGEFFEFQPGSNMLSVESQNAVSLRLTFTPRFMYGAVFDDVDWGDDDA